MKEIVIWHNPRCSKSREAVVQLKKLENSKKIKLTIRLYLKETPTLRQLNQVYSWLNLNTPKEWMRKNEKIYQDLHLDEVDQKDQLLELMVQNPVLIERPVVIDQEHNKAIIARPIEKLDQLLKRSME